MLATPSKFLPPNGIVTMAYRDQNDYAAFMEKAREAVAMIRSTPLGERLVGEIERSPKTVNIVRCGRSNIGCIIGDANQLDAACYKEVLTDAALLSLLTKLQKDTKTKDSIGLMHASRKLPKYFSTP